MRKSIYNKIDSAIMMPSKILIISQENPFSIVKKTKRDEIKLSMLRNEYFILALRDFWVGTRLSEYL